VKEKAERKGRNPATGDDLMLKPRRVVTFKYSGKLREKINGGRLSVKIHNTPLKVSQKGGLS